MNKEAYFGLMGRIREVELELHEAALALDESEPARAMSCVREAHARISNLLDKMSDAGAH